MTDAIKAIKIDAFSFRDFDKVLRFLKKNNITVLSENKKGMVIVAEMTNALVNEMLETVDTDDEILHKIV